PSASPGGLMRPPLPWWMKRSAATGSMCRLVPTAVDAVVRMASRWPLGPASSANRLLIDLELDEAGLAQHFRLALSTEEVGRGKPARDTRACECPLERFRLRSRPRKRTQVNLGSSLRLDLRQELTPVDGN